MKRLPSEPPRLRDLPPEEERADVARLVRSAGRAPADPVPSLKWRIRRTLRRKSARRRGYLRAAVVGGMMFLTGGVVGAVVQPILRLRQQTKLESVADVGPLPTTPRSRRRRAPATPPAPTTEDMLAPDEAALPSPSPPSVLPPPPASARPAPAGVGLRAMLAEPLVRGLRARGTPASAPMAASAATPSPAPLSPPEAPRLPADHRPLRTAMLEPAPRPWQPPSWPAPSPPTVAAPAQPSVATPSPVAVGSPLPVAPAVASPAPPLALATTVPAAPAVTVAPTEQALLARALRGLRSQRRPESALAALDEYVARYPSGSLLPEARHLRTEALLALGHKRAALAELNRDAVAGNAGGEERRLVRGELRAAAGLWREAFEDFDAIVRVRGAHAPEAATTAKPGARFERALWGRASARSHLGDDPGARADLQECLRRFPQGRFAAQASRLLGELR